MRSKADEMVSLIKRIAQKKKQKPSSSEVTVGQLSVKAVLEEEVKLREIGFIKQVSFKPGVEEKGNNG